MIHAEVSWRREAGLNRAYVWLSDGTVVGYRDLDTGTDHVPAEYADLHVASINEWLRTYGVRCHGLEPFPDIGPRPGGWGPWAWRRRSKWQRAEDQRVAAFTSWKMDRPGWRVPVDPPHGGWRDLVRNEPAEALWQKSWSLAASAPPGAATHQETRAWRAGAVGEETVAAELWKLCRPSAGAWRALHSVPVGKRGSDIDHLLVGPAGVFTINTKSHVGSSIWTAGTTFMVNGHHQPYIRNSQHEAARAARLLSEQVGKAVPVRGVIVLVDPRELTVKVASPDVSITTRTQLGRWARAQPGILSYDEVNDVFAAARRSTTWS